VLALLALVDAADAEDAALVAAVWQVEMLCDAVLALAAAAVAELAAAVAEDAAFCSEVSALLTLSCADVTADNRSVAVAGVTLSLMKKPAGALMVVPID
jgi:hypothetical protein